MSRPKMKNADLPVGMFFRNGGYHLATSLKHGRQRQILLSRDREIALMEYRRLYGDFFDSANADLLRKEMSRIYKKAQYNAEQRGFPFELTMDELMQIGERSKWRCALTKLAFSLNKKEGCKFRPFAPSLDRIDSAKGYTLENCRLVCFAVNAAMNEWGESVFKVVAAAYCGRRLPAREAKSFGNLDYDGQSAA